MFDHFATLSMKGLMTSKEALTKHRQQVADQSTQIRQVVLTKGKHNECRKNTNSRKLNFKRYS